MKKQHLAGSYPVELEFDTHLDLTGYTAVTGKLVDSVGTVINSALALTITQAKAGLVSYTTIAGDFPTAGNYEMQLTLVKSGVSYKGPILIIPVARNL